MKKSVLVVMGLLLSMSAYAKNRDCGVVFLSSVSVQADRLDGSTHGNKMLIGFKSQACRSIKWAYLENSDEAYDGMLSIAMTAYLHKRRLAVFVDESKDASGAKRIQRLTLQ